MDNHELAAIGRSLAGAETARAGLTLREGQSPLRDFRPTMRRTQAPQTPESAPPLPVPERDPNDLLADPFELAPHEVPAARQFAAMLNYGLDVIRRQYGSLDQVIPLRRKDSPYANRN